MGVYIISLLILLLKKVACEWVDVDPLKCTFWILFLPIVCTYFACWWRSHQKDLTWKDWSIPGMAFLRSCHRPNRVHQRLVEWDGCRIRSSLMVKQAPYPRRPFCLSIQLTRWIPSLQFSNISKVIENHNQLTLGYIFECAVQSDSTLLESIFYEIDRFFFYFFIPLYISRKFFSSK